MSKLILNLNLTTMMNQQSTCVLTKYNQMLFTLQKRKKKEKQSTL